MPPSPYPARGRTDAGPPAVVPWQKAYCAAMAAVYLLLFGFGLVLAVFRESLADATDSPTDNLIAGLLIAAVSLPLAAIFAAGPFLPRRPWAWTYHIVLIALGMTSCACLPFTVPLLIFWIRPDTQAWFGRFAAAGVPAVPAVSRPPGG
jgi:hypothetical protein